MPWGSIVAGASTSVKDNISYCEERDGEKKRWSGKLKSKRELHFIYKRFLS